MSSIVRLAAFAESGSIAARAEPCRPNATIIVCLDNEVVLRRAGRAPRSHRSFLVGPGCGPLITSHDADLSCVEIEVVPWALPALVGTAVDAGEVIDLADLLGDDGDGLIDRLTAGAGWPTRFALIEHFLLRRLAVAGREIVPEVRWAWGRLQSTGGQVSIASLAREIGWSPRRFGRRFFGETGVMPKVAARRLRFDRARRMVEGTTALLADVALACGYSDQSHMTRDFAQFAGSAPGALRARSRDLPGTTPSAVGH